MLQVKVRLVVAEAASAATCCVPIKVAAAVTLLSVTVKDVVAAVVRLLTPTTTVTLEFTYPVEGVNELTATSGRLGA